MTTTFKIRTRDAGWIAAHDGVTDAEGWTAIQVPAAEVDTFTSFGRDWIRRDFGKDIPKDAQCNLIVFPVVMLGA
jgi:hypothetical protein